MNTFVCKSKWSLKATSTCEVSAHFAVAPTLAHTLWRTH